MSKCVGLLDVRKQLRCLFVCCRSQFCYSCRSWDCCKSQAVAGPLQHTASLSLISLETDTVQLPAFRLLYSSLYLTATAASKCLIALQDKIYILPAQILLHVFPRFPFSTPLRFLQTLCHASSCIYKLLLRFRLAKEKSDLETIYYVLRDVCVVLFAVGCGTIVKMVDHQNGCLSKLYGMVHPELIT